MLIEATSDHKASEGDSMESPCSDTVLLVAKNAPSGSGERGKRGLCLIKSCHTREHLQPQEVLFDARPRQQKYSRSHPWTCSCHVLLLVLL